ncbi:MAG: hypothetical protein KA408_12700 [Flavobacteriales bacterium]|nr:hypothetical protein [Flavobacteriales bacterium]
MNLTTAHSLWLAPLCLALGIALAWILYRNASGKEGFGRNLAILLAALRALAIAVIAFFLLEPMVRILVREVRKPVVVILHDGSSSILSNTDSASFQQSYGYQLEQLGKDLGENYEVREFTYGQEVTDGITLSQREGLTDIGQALREVYDRLSGPDLGAVIIDGDGIFNRGRDPRLDATRLGVPVYTVALGDTTVRPDLVLRGVDNNRISYLGNDFPVMVRVEGRHMKGKQTRVAILQSGKEVAAKDVSITADPFTVEIPFTLKADKPGLQRFTAVVRPLNDEISEVNNARAFLVDVLDDRQKILLLGAAPHPDLGALRSALAGLDGYESELAYAADFSGNIDEFDLIILHQLPSAKQNIQTLLQRAATRNIPLCFLLGQGMDFNAFNQQNSGVQVTGARTAITDAQAAFNKDFTYFTVDQDQQRAIERFPPLQVPFGQYDLGRSASALLMQRIGVVRTAYPLIAFSQQGERRMATVAGEGLWRWRVADQQLNGSHERFDRLVHKMVQFLALKVDKNRFRVEHAPDYTENDPVLINAELYNASFEPVNNVEASILLKDEDGREYPYTFSPNGTAYRLDAGRLPAGRYTWSARAQLEGQRYTASGELNVSELLAEQFSTVADHGLWNDIATNTGGQMVYPRDLATLAELIQGKNQLKARSYAHDSFSDLIGLKWIFFVILALLTLEWVLRRRNGAY